MARKAAAATDTAASNPYDRIVACAIRLASQTSFRDATLIQSLALEQKAYVARLEAHVAELERRLRSLAADEADADRKVSSAGRRG